MRLLLEIEELLVLIAFLKVESFVSFQSTIILWKCLSDSGICVYFAGTHKLNKQQNQGINHSYWINYKFKFNFQICTHKVLSNFMVSIQLENLKNKFNPYIKSIQFSLLPHHYKHNAKCIFKNLLIPWPFFLKFGLQPP